MHHSTAHVLASCEAVYSSTVLQPVLVHTWGLNTKDLAKIVQATLGASEIYIATNTCIVV